MIQVSDEFKRLMRERTDFRGYVEARLADGTELTFTADDLAVGGCSVTDGAGASGLPLGAAVCRTVKLELVNPDGHLDGYDFYGAELRVWLTFRLTDGEERVELGTFTVTEPETGGETVTLTAGDAMVRADKLYRPAGGNMTLGELWRDVCDQCGLHYDTAVFPNSDFTVSEVEAGQHTCRQMLGYIAMLAGGNARVDRQGTVRILTYDKNKEPDHALDAWSSLNVDTDDVLVTGLEIQGEDGTVLEGEEGYVLQVEDPLLAGREAQGLKRMGDILLGLRVRRFDGSHIAYPLAEFMDTARLMDRRGRTYDTVLTDVTFTFGGYTALADSAEGALRSGSRYVSAETKARVAARQMVEREKTAREQAMERMNETLQKASGLYCTAQEQPDESTIYYLHDKKTMEESTLVMKLTAEAIGFSTDGGKTYPYGFTVTGEMVMGIIRSEGLSADWINTGTLNLNVMKLEGTLCGLMQGYGSTKNGSTTKGIVMYAYGVDDNGFARPPYLILTNEGIRCQLSDDQSFNMSNGIFEVLGDITVTKVGDAGGNIVTRGNVNAQGGHVFVSDHEAVKWEEDTDLMTFGGGDRSYFAGKQVYLGGFYTGFEAWVRGETVTLQASNINESVQPTVTSDKREKKDIEALPAAYERLLDGMEPVRFRYKNEPADGPFHLGYIAQDVGTALAAAGMDRGDLAALADIPQEDGEKKLGIAYGELIALLHLKINSLEARLAELEEKMTRTQQKTPADWPGPLMEREN